ncbi:hypothetical protein V1498_17395 [Peribacillus sp. SCS-26]|uniref:hypothetical protein n=1 Tax=Paraperibacillus marinus TaxID=3115295 RepID=UPI0039064D74
MLRKSIIREQIITAASSLTLSHTGLEILYQYGPSLDEHGFFLGTPWEHMSDLKPPLVRGTLESGNYTAILETISNLRILSAAIDSLPQKKINPQAARDYLNEVIGLNLDTLFGPDTEQARIQNIDYPQTRTLLSYILTRYSPPDALDYLLKEIEKLSVQRPIITDKIEQLINTGIRLLPEDKGAFEKFSVYQKAVEGPSPSLYESILYDSIGGKADFEAIKNVAEEMAASMKATGLVSKVHAELAVYVNKTAPSLNRYILGLGKAGISQLADNAPLISALMDSAITPETRQALYGLSLLLDRNILTPVTGLKLEGLLNSPPCSSSADIMKKVFNAVNEEAARGRLLSGTISALGQPLGIAQGHNPSCQSTRALSYWSQTNPSLLLQYIGDVWTRGYLEMEFEGLMISSEKLEKKQLNYSIAMDPISVLLLPHLDAVYSLMLKYAGLRAEDPHKWVNPSFYQEGILQNFADRNTAILFTELFYYYYHPVNINLFSPVLPQPAGIVIYDRNDEPLGAHAVLIQRTAYDPQGEARVYFYNPNNDSKQQWGREMDVTVSGHGEQHGEASLPFAQFTKCLYAFHY